MEWFKKKMRVFLFVCLLFPFYSYAAKISLSISGKIEDHSAMLYFPDGRELPISIDASGKGELVVDVTEPVYVALGYHYISRTLLLTPDSDSPLRQLLQDLPSYLTQAPLAHPKTLMQF